MSQLEQQLRALDTSQADDAVNPADIATTWEKKLAVLQDRFATLEQKFNSIQLDDNEINDDKESRVADGSVTSDITNEAIHKSIRDHSALSRARILINKYDPAIGERRDQLLDDTVPDIAKKEDEAVAFRLRKNVDSSRQDSTGELEILSHDLWQLLKKILSDYPGHTFLSDPVTINSPYEALVLNWDKLEKAAKGGVVDDKEHQARSDLKLLLATICTSSGDAKLDKYFKMRQSSRELKSVTFESLWTLFAPGTLVYGKPFLGHDQLFIVQHGWRSWPRPNVTSWPLACWTYDWDGKVFKRMPLKLELECFEGHKPITSLAFYPLDYHSDRNSIMQNLMKRGDKYKRICNAKQGSRMFDYKGSVVIDQKGFSLLTGDDDEDDGTTRSSYDYDLRYLLGRRSRKPGAAPNESAGNPSTNVDSRVMVDFESYFRYGPAVARVGPLNPIEDLLECVCIECQNHTGTQRTHRRRFDKDACQTEWEDEQYMLCPPRILGYVLRDKQWAQLQVTCLEAIPKEDPDHSWDRVKLPDGNDTKKMILNLVNGHRIAELKDDDSGLMVDDIVAKKGKGLVILLYGPPGVGKTSTAETVAIAARKPLFSISVADVGTKAKNVEANLAKIFALATSSQAILLIDEADVFLESRGLKGGGNTTDRNALVSVFLRVLEYYQGILMLTTNQIANFDVAVQSRIHVAIKYTQLSPGQTIAIFNGFLRPLVDRGCVDEYDDIQEWIREDMSGVGLDGRQIRNIVTSALALARAEKKTKLDKKHLKRISNNVRNYKHDFIVQFERYKNSQEGMVSDRREGM